MEQAGLPFPNIDPVIFSIGPFAVRWYALAYIAGLILGWRYCLSLCRRAPRFMEPSALDDLLVYVTLGVVLGGRLGYVLFYNLSYYLENPSQILMVWNGGMAFHGGMLGTLAGLFLFARRRGINPLAVGDIVAAAAPIGLFFGRVANFINGELYGRATDMPWSMVFPDGGLVPRHPSQLYEAVLEGLLLFILIVLLIARTDIRRYPGAIGGLFLAGYGIARFIVEFFREPDAQLGFPFADVTMGQLLSIPMILVGIAIMCRVLRRPPISENA